ncbi:MAG TPA: HAD hydrolase-like protein [bacterium]|nr:HAD hydrolase-like protein [bacterium]HPO82233.1 HAD hydrolase-like protein [bacterium]HRU33016.1 HAD hydrolase-like protein [bacterium]
MRPEIIVFDIDGVLIDTLPSFRVAVSRTVQYYITEILKYDDTGLFILPEEVQFFKIAGGFNDDWVLSQSIILFFIYKAITSGLKDTRSVRLIPPSFEDFTRDISCIGEGLEKVEKYISNMDNNIISEIKSRLDKELVIRIFQEIYAGSEDMKRLYGSEPLSGKEEGLWRRERIILDKALLIPDLFYGIYTGRTASETELALNMLKLDIPPQAIITMDSSIIKPDPRGLEIIRSYYKREILAFVGDSMDDILTAINGNAIPVAIAKDDISRERFSHYTSLIFNNVNEYLMSLNKIHLSL